MIGALKKALEFAMCAILFASGLGGTLFIAWAIYLFFHVCDLPGAVCP